MHWLSSCLLTGSSKGVLVFLTLDNAPVAGGPVHFTVKVINKQKVAKKMRLHLNAQAKKYNNSPSDTFWETHGVLQLAPMEGKSTFHSSTDSNFHFWKTVVVYISVSWLSPSGFPAKVIHQQILPDQYERVVGDDLINLAVVLEDMASQERVLASEEFNITSSQLTIQVLEKIVQTCITLFRILAKKNNF